jgi:putative peptidoglycan lipid II flippase
MKGIALFKAAGILFGGGVIGKALGFVRDILLAAAYGTTRNMDAFSVSQTGMLIPAHLIIGEGLNAGFIPLYSRYRRESPERANAFFWLMTLGTGGLSLLIVALLWALMRVWMGFLVQGFDEASLNVTIEFTRVTMLSLPFYVQGNLFAHLEMANERFFLASVRAAIQNLGIMAGILAAVLLRKPVFLAWGFTGSYVLFCLLGIWRAWRGNLAGRPGGWGHDMLVAVSKEFWVIIRPVLFLPAVVQMNCAVERIVASRMGAGVVAAMMFARNLSESGLVLIAWPVGLAGLAEFSRMTAEEAQLRMGRILPILLVVLLPISAFLAINNRMIIKVIFERGLFNAESVRLASPIFLGLIAGFWAQVISFVLLRTLNAQLRNIEVAFYLSAGMAVNVAVNLFAYRQLGPFVLGISATAGSLVTLLLSVRALRLGGVMLRYAALLLVGTVLYLPVALLVRRESLVNLIVVSALSFVFWALFILCIPSLRRVCLDELRRRKVNL